MQQFLFLIWRRHKLFRKSADVLPPQPMLCCDRGGTLIYSSRQNSNRRPNKNKKRRILIFIPTYHNNSPLRPHSFQSRHNYRNKSPQGHRTLNSLHSIL